MQFIERKIGTAVMLDKGECNGSYSDACVILSALLSGIAAELRPGKGIDRARFVELWARYCSAELDGILVSVPFLRQFLRRSERWEEVHALENARPNMFGLGHGTRVLRGKEVDMTEADVLALPIRLAKKEVRVYTYPAVFYEHVRSNLAHEYRLSENASSHFATRLKANVSYVNMHDPDEAELSRRLIHFHIDWLANVTRSIAANVAKFVEHYQRLPQPNWWLLG